jgi:hypothetical protein
MSEPARHQYCVIDDQSVLFRAGITLAALLFLSVYGTGIPTLGSVLGLEQLVPPLLVVAQIPVVIALVAVWSIGCNICRTEGVR